MQNSSTYARVNTVCRDSNFLVDNIGVIALVGFFILGLVSMIWAARTAPIQAREVRALSETAWHSVALSPQITRTLDQCLADTLPRTRVSVAGSYMVVFQVRNYANVDEAWHAVISCEKMIEVIDPHVGLAMQEARKKVIEDNAWPMFRKRS